MNWLLRNLKSRAAFALKHPKYAGAVLLSEVLRSDERFLADITRSKVSDILRYLDEPYRTHEFSRHIESIESEFRSAPFASSDLYAKKTLLQYAAVRAMKPDRIVETGIANGVSSAHLLLAIQKNGRGKLHSIGLDDRSFLPSGKITGWIVPEWLGDNWHPHIGDATKLLPEVLLTHGPVDIFFHDSSHDYVHMLWEFRTSYGYIRPGGLLISDDALWNDAFSSFGREVGARKSGILHGVGFLLKE